MPIFLAVLVVLALAAVPAFALNTHAFSFSFGSSGSAAGEVSSPSGVAVNAVTHDVYVADSGNFRVDEFSSSGTFMRAWGWGVADGLPAFETCTLVCQVGLSGSGAGQFTTPAFVAVDNSKDASAEDVYVGDTGDNLVTKFGASGNLISGWGSGGQLNGSTAADGPFGPIAGTAVDSSGTLDVLDTNSKLFEFAQDASFTADFVVARGTLPNGLAVDASGSFFKVNGDNSIEKFGGSGNDVGQVSASDTAIGLAVDASTGDLYVDNGGASVSDYAFDGSGNVVGSSCAPAASSGCAPTDSFGFGHLNGAAGLAADTSSHTVFAADAGDGQIAAFTSIVLPDVTTNPASSIGPTTATVNGHLDPAGGGNVTDCHFEYTDDANFQANGFSGAATAPCAEGNAFSSPATVHADLSGLSLETAYHVRLTATDAAGTNAGQDQPFTTTSAVQQVITGAATNVLDGTATLNGTVNAGGTTITDCHFDYVTEAAFQSTGYTDLSSGGSIPCATTPTGSSPTPVHADLTGLVAVTAYHFRLQATNSIGTTTGQDQSFQTVGPPLIHGESASSVGISTATLTAQINSQFADTTYRLEYGTAGPCSSNPCASYPAHAIDLGSGSTDIAVSVTLAGLEPGIAYDYRFLATNSVSETPGPDKTFTTSAPGPPPPTCANARPGYSAKLPDCRAYEQASPVDKNGGSVIDTPSFTQASSSGGAITFFSAAGFPGGVGSQTLPDFLSSRGSAGWSTQGLLLPPTFGHANPGVLGWNEDMSAVVDQAGSIANGTTGLFLRDSSDGSIQTIVPYSGLLGSYRVDVTSADGSVVFFDEEGAQLTSNAANGHTNLYAWNRSTGVVSLVGVLPDGTTPPSGSFAGPYDWTEANTNFGGSTGAEGHGYQLQYEHAVSSDASRVFFTAAGSGQLYLRENPTSSGASTAHVSASQKTNGSGPGGTDPNGPQPAAFMFATPDGSQALLTSPEELTNDATTGTADQGSDLYRYDTATGRLTDLTPDTSDPNGAQVQGVLGMSDDGSSVYFVANGVLATGATTGTCNGGGLNKIAEEGTCNLYVWHDGTIRFVAQLDVRGSEGDQVDWNAYETNNAIPQTARVSADGQTVLFASTRQLTGYDNVGPCSGGNEPCRQLYRYSASSGQLTCVSCDPTGATPMGPAELEIAYNTRFSTSFSPSEFLTRNLSASGDQVFFDSPDPLVPQDQNGVIDPYEWEADGAGSCHSSAVNGGCLYLLSSGSSPNPSYFADASASGNDAFIVTEQALVGQDQDQLADIYDARVGGGLASQNPTQPPPCNGENCRPPGSGAPPSQTPGSVTFVGPANPTPAAATATPRIGIAHKRGTRSSLILTVAIPAKGRLTITGAGLNELSKPVSKAGTYLIVVGLTKKEKALLRHKHKLTLKATLRFTPSSGSPSSVTVSVTVRA